MTMKKRIERMYRCNMCGAILVIPDSWRNDSERALEDFVKKHTHREPKYYGRSFTVITADDLP